MNAILIPAFLLTMIRYCHSRYFNDDLDTWRCYSCYPNDPTTEINCPRSDAYRNSPTIHCWELRVKLVPWRRCKTHIRVDVNGTLRVVERICIFRPEFVKYYPKSCFKHKIGYHKETEKHYYLFICDCDSYHCSGTTAINAYLLTLGFIVLFSLIYL